MKMGNIKRILIAVLMIAGISLRVTSQDCGVYFPVIKGIVYEMQQFDNKDKLTGTNTYSVTSVDTDASGKLVATIHSHWKGKSEKDTVSTNISYRCEDGKTYLEMKNFAPSGEQFKDMEIKTDASTMEIPVSLSVGMELPDASGTMSFYSNGTLFSTIKTTFTERKVASQESVTTPAGTFQCYKVTYNVSSESTTMGFKMTTNSKSVEYYSTGTGMVKSEFYNKNDKLEGYSVLSKITNP